MAKKLLMTAKELENKEKWLEVRKNYIGGSEAGSIVGLNKYKSSFALWLEKTGQAEPPDLSDNLKVWFGTELENAVAKKFCSDMNKKVQKTGLYVNDKYPWACASIDRLIVGDNVPLECKTTGQFNKKMWEGDNIPDSYYCQILHYMTVLEVDYCYIACMFGNGDDFIIKKVDFNEEDAKALMNAEKEFYEKYIVGGETPDVDGTDNCAEVLKNKYKGGEYDEEYELPSDAENIVARLSDLKEEKSKLENEITFCSNEIKEMMKDNEIGKTNSFIVTWKSQAAKESFNKEKLKEEMPKIYQKYLKAGSGGTRVLRIKKYDKEEE